MGDVVQFPEGAVHNTERKTHPLGAMLARFAEAAPGLYKPDEIAEVINAECPGAMRSYILAKMIMRATEDGVLRAPSQSAFADLPRE